MCLCASYLWLRRLMMACAHLRMQGLQHSTVFARPWQALSVSARRKGKRNEEEEVVEL